MSLLRKLGLSHIVENQPMKDEKKIAKESRHKKILFYFLIVLFSIILLGIWIASLLLPNFDVTPTELRSTGGEANTKPINNAFEQIGEILEQ
ncbi:hypothetical protein H6776_02980 [Candidatus Nomurabacteria bacterium]|nr:hypothetical protein [Candidatus Nomurabacteria bacterium]